MPGNEIGGFDQNYSANELFHNQGLHQESQGQMPQDIANRASNPGYGIGVALRKLLEYFNLVQSEREVLAQRREHDLANEGFRAGVSSQKVSSKKEKSSSKTKEPSKFSPKTISQKDIDLVNNAFEKNKHKIKIRYSRSQKEEQKEEFDKMVIGKFKKAIMSYLEEGFLVSDIVDFLNSIKKIILFDQGKFSASEKSPFIGVYGSVDDNFYLRINSNSQEQFVSTLAHEIRHFQQFRRQDFWSKEYLDKCHLAVKNLRDMSKECIFSSLRYSECEKIFEYAKENKHRPILIETPSHKVLELDFAVKNGFRIDIVKNEDGSEKVVLVGIEKNGKIVKPLEKEEKLYELLRNMDLPLLKHDMSFKNSYKEMPTDKAATYDSFFGFFGKDFRAKFEEYFRAFIELGPHLLTSLPRESLFDLCGEPEIETNLDRLKEYGKTNLLSVSIEASQAEGLDKKKQQRQEEL